MGTKIQIKWLLIGNYEILKIVRHVLKDRKKEKTINP